MKRIALLLAVGMIVSSSTGCGLFRRVRDFCNRGDLCQPGGPALAGPAFGGPTFAGPAQVIVPAPAPCIVPGCDPCCDPCCGPTLTSLPVGHAGCGCEGGTLLPGVIDGASGAVPYGFAAPGFEEDPRPLRSSPSPNPPMAN